MKGKHRRVGSTAAQRAERWKECDVDSLGCVASYCVGKSRARLDRKRGEGSKFRRGEDISLRFDIAHSDHLGPFLGFRHNQVFELGRRAGKH
jgi:hypothetical protein